MKIKCQFCKTTWDMRDLRHHPMSQEWARGDLVACPYCIDEQRAVDEAIARLAREVKPENLRKEV